MTQWAKRLRGRHVGAEEDRGGPGSGPPPSPPSRGRFRRWLLAAVAALAGAVGGVLVVKAVLALPLPEPALFGLCGLIAVVLIVGAAWWSQPVGRAVLAGAFLGMAGSVALVLLVVA